MVGGPATGIILLLGTAIGFRANPRASGILLVWFAGSVLHTPIFFNRYLMGGLPAAVTLGAVGMAQLAGWPWWSTRIAAVVLLGIAVVENLSVITSGLHRLI
jgi:hypothetical protein